MTGGDSVHAVLREHEDFAEFLEELDTPERVDSFRVALEIHGEATAEAFDHNPAELGIRELGLTRIAWEAHHQREGDERIKRSI